MKELLDHILSYSLEDFVPIGVETYQRLFQRVNDSFWPWHLLTCCIGIVLIYLLLKRNQQRFIGPLLGLMWFTSAYQFHWIYFAELTWVAHYLAFGFIAQGLMLWLLFFSSERLNAQHHQFNLTRMCAVFIVAFAILIYPLLSLLTEQGWSNAEVFGVAPDPTALATLGILLFLRRWWLMPVPLAWLIVSGIIDYSI